jgi:hypothetical protein
MMGVVAGANGVEIVLLHQIEIIIQRFLCYCLATSVIVLVVIDASDRYRHSI